MECGRILSYLLYGSVTSLPSPSSNIEAWPSGDYSTAIYLFDKYSSHMFLLIYNPPTNSSYRIQADSLIDCISSYFNDDLVSSNSFTILGDINLVDVCWAKITAHSDYSKAILEKVESLNLLPLVFEPTLQVRKHTRYHIDFNSRTFYGLRG